MLERTVVDGQHDLTPALVMLNDLGLSDPPPGFRRALSAALTHSSYLYEHPEELPGVTGGLLEALQALGSTYLRKLAAVRAYQRQPFSAVGHLAKHVGQVPPEFQRWAVEQTWVLRLCRVGRSLNVSSLPPSVAAALFRQLLGLLCLAGRESVAESLLDDLVSGAASPQAIADPKTELQEQLADSRPSYEYYREGPDHAAVFRAVVTDNDGRQGAGEGGSKKVAGRNAALDFLQRHLPHVVRAQADREVRKPLFMEIPGPEPHRRAVRRVQDLFSLSPAARPLLGQALVHASWAYEQRDLMARCGQQDNQVLGFMGSQVLNFEAVLIQAARAVISPPEEFRLNTPPNTVFDTAFRHADLVPALLLGVGQASEGIPIELGSNAFQALLGAVFIAKGFPVTLSSEWPLEWGPLWRIFTEAPNGLDPTTELGRAASSMQLDVDFEVRESGPDHRTVHHATAVLSSAVLGARMRAAEGSGIRGKTPARFRAAEVVLDVLDALGERRPAQALLTRSEVDQSTGRFILAHQAAVLAGHRIPLPRWIAGRLFGLHWAGSPEALVEWAAESDLLLTQIAGFEADRHHFEGAFRAAHDAEVADDQARGIDVELAKVLGLLEQLEDPESLTRDHLDRLTQLCDIYRCLGTDDPDIGLAELIDDWKVLYRGQLDVAVGASMTDGRLTGRERAVLDAIATAVMKPNTPISVEVLGQRPLRLRFASSSTLDPATVTQMCALWSGVTRTATLVPTDFGVDVAIVGADAPVSPGPITRAALAVLQPVTEPYLASVADLLHDLKNQVVAARLAVSTPAGSRTARLEQQLTASRHLDQAHALALRLRASTSTLGKAGEESVELGTFLRSYAAAVLSRLPGSISLSIPDASSVVHVALGERVLSAVLDNLVGNAIEAMPDGGAITLEWTADEYETVVEVADNGPGLPAEVVAALASGDRIRSTKPGGNGLGLLGASALLNRAGGQLAALPAGSGTAWLVTLPIATMMNLETE
ncbi:ATP-binding protein (plasmid) [Streptomyces viridifaciens]|nr:ATP-binding protein [Streptomyces viridifaciens]